MATQPLQAPTVGQNDHTQPFDAELSARLDVLITELDEQPPRLRRAWLRLRKMHLERHVPAFGQHKEVQR